jgi:hypothetical protein
MNSACLSMVQTGYVCPFYWPEIDMSDFVFVEYVQKNEQTETVSSRWKV